MAIIFTLDKLGRIKKTKVKESIYEIWDLINVQLREIDPNSKKSIFNRDFILLTDENENPLIINKKNIWKIKEK
jgi:hypothetical protein